MQNNIEIRYNRKKESRNMFFTAAGLLISLIGSQIYTFASGLYILKSTGSSLGFSANLVISILPMVIINPLAGVIADRIDRKKTAIIMDLLNGILMMVMYIIGRESFSVHMIYIGTFFISVFSAIYNVVMEAAKPDIVYSDSLIRINSLSKVIEAAASIAGPALGGIVYALVDIRSFILFNGISFFISAVFEVFTDFKLNLQIKIEKAKLNIVHDIKEGIMYIINDKNLNGLIGIFVVINFFLGFAYSVPIPYVLNNVFKLKTLQYGIIQAAFPIGLIAGALPADRFIKKVTENKLLMLSSIILGTAIFISGLPAISHIPGKVFFYIVFYSSINIVMGAAVSLIDIPVIVLLQKTVEADLRGRVMSTSISVVKIILPLALVISGLIVNEKSSGFVICAGGAVLSIICYIFYRKAFVKVKVTI